MPWSATGGGRNTGAVPSTTCGSTYCFEGKCGWIRFTEIWLEVWVRMQELESREIQDEGEEFFNSLDPQSWEDKNKDAFGSFILTFRW